MTATSQYLTTTAKLLPYPRRSGHGASSTTAFHYEASGPQAALGDILAVIEVLAPIKEANEVSNLILETATRTYYLDPENETDTVIDRFEDTIKAINEELAVYATAGHGSWIGKVSAILAVMVGNEVHLTQTGSAQAFLYRGKQSSCITTGLASKEPHRPSKTFANMASGRLEIGDRLFLATPALLHHFSSEELADTISQNTPTTAIDKLRVGLGPGESLERFAATISELTTPDQAAMVPQTGLPKAAMLGKPETGLARVRDGAKPALAKAGALSLAAGSKLGSFWRSSVQPWIKSTTLTLIQMLRKLLSKKSGRWMALAALILVIATIVWSVSHLGTDKALAGMAKSYDQAYAKQATAAQQLANGDKLGAKTNYQAALDQLNLILVNPKSSKLPAYLAKHKKDSDDPASPQQLRNLVQAQIDQIDGLTQVSGGQLADFSALSNAKPTLMAQVGNQFVFSGPADGSSIYIYNLATSKLSVVANHPSLGGKVVAISASSNSDGVYLLTDKPGVWFLRTSDNNLSQIAASGAWPKGKAIASYLGNLYILLADDSGVSKLTPVGSGFSLPSPYPVNDPSVLKGSTAMAVDGSIYVANPNGFSRIFSGVVQKSDLVIPSNLKALRQIASVNAGKSLIMVDAKSERIGLFSFDGAAVSYNGQLAVKGAKQVYSALGNGVDKNLYVLADQKFYKITY